MVNNLHQKCRYKSLFFSLVLCVLNCHLFILPTFPVSLFFPSGRNRKGFLSLLLHFFGNKIHRIQQNQAAKEEWQIYWMMSWWFCVCAFLLALMRYSISTTDFQTLSVAQPKWTPRSWKMRSLGDLITHRKPTGHFVKESEMVFYSKARILSRLD